MRQLLSVLAFAAVIAAFAPGVRAQFSPVPNTGCTPNTSFIKWAGTGQLGTQIDVKSGCSALSETPFLLLGGPQSPIPLGPPIACLNNCVLAVNPWLHVGGAGGSPSISIPVPNNPALIGARMRFQGACVDLGRGCLTLTMAVELTVN